jgi:hypothetical protein
MYISLTKPSAKGDLAEDMECKNIMMVQQLPVCENFPKIFLKEWFNKGDLHEINDSSVRQVIKEKLTKGAMMMVRWMVIRRVGCFMLKD